LRGRNKRKASDKLAFFVSAVQARLFVMQRFAVLADVLELCRNVDRACAQHQLRYATSDTGHGSGRQPSTGQGHGIAPGVAPSVPTGTIVSAAGSFIPKRSKNGKTIW